MLLGGPVLAQSFAPVMSPTKSGTIVGQAPEDIMKPGQISGLEVISGPDTGGAKPAVAAPGGPYVVPMVVQPRAPAPAVVELPTPRQPLSGVTLPNLGRPSDAYNGGGVVLEQDGRGVTRQVR
jgi:hypothetical protein